jgi:hypothetical protein
MHIEKKNEIGKFSPSFLLPVTANH